ncbi:MAG: TetR/AcrR family transcriptional regulator [Chloroflexota bacterium]|nr:TetR/AcrR family transcriptional regulator [Chloroflexota bacterium]
MEMSVIEKELDPRVRRTQSYILDAFRALLSEKAFKSITVKEITERAGINRTTFYAHYQDKFDLLNAALQMIFEAELEQNALNVCHYSRENLKALLRTVCQFIRDSSTECKLANSQFELIVEKQVRRQIQDLIEMWLEEVEGVRDKKSAAVATSWTIYGLAEHWSQDPDQGGPERYIDRVLPLVTANLPAA